MNTNNLIIDGTNISFRYYHVTRKDKQKNNSGKSVEIINKYLSGLLNLVALFNPDKIYITWDKKQTANIPSYRQVLMDGLYKDGREKPIDVQELYDQEEVLSKIFLTLGISSFYPNSLEADDVVAYLAKKVEGTSVIVSVDQDLLQLIDERTSVWNLKNLVTINNFESHVGINRKLYKLYKAIKGDIADGIHGLPGYGKVRATRLAKLWSESTIAPEYAEIVNKNLKLIDLDYGISTQKGEIEFYDKQFEENKLVTSNKNKFIDICTKEDIAININEWNRFFNRNNLVDIINSISAKYTKGV